MEKTEKERQRGGWKKRERENGNPIHRDGRDEYIIWGAGCLAVIHVVCSNG